MRMRSRSLQSSSGSIRDLLQCVYGAEEKAETACALLAGSEVIETPGGHHFDGDYGAITRRIVDGLASRGALPAPG